MISNSGKDENGRYTGGAAGDQTGTEWEIRSWYNRPWDGVLRYTGTNTDKVRRTIRNISIKAARNNNIGYDQNERWTYWNALKSVGYDPSKITTKCESDCSAGVLANCKATGYLLDIDALKNINQDGYTGNMKQILGNAGFEWLDASKYREGESYLIEGDILLNIKSHTATYVGDGSIVDDDPTPSSDNPYDRLDIKPYESNNSVKEIQARLTVLGWYNLEIDGIYGGGTYKSICDFQEKYGLGADGYAAHNGSTWAKIDELMGGRHATIRPDWRGKDVVDMCKAMNLFGYRTNGIGGNYISEDGTYGTPGHSGLYNAICQFQEDYDMGADGIASATGITWATVDRLYNSLENVYVTASSLNVRRGRSTNTEIITTIANGSWHKKTNEVNGWAYLHDVGGWVSSQYIK